MGADKHERKRKQAQLRHVRLYHWMMRCPAWQSLSPVARCLYLEMAARYAGVNSNNGQIPYSVREGAAALRVGKSTANKGLRELVDRGFIVPTKAGIFTIKRATEWRLTEFPCDVTNAVATKDFMRWEPAEIQKEVPVAGRIVPAAGLSSTCSGTDVANMSRNSTPSGTVDPPKFNSQSRLRYTTSLPGGTEPSSPPVTIIPSPQLLEIERRRQARAQRAPNSAQATRARGRGAA